ncbi:MAG: TolC family protein [Muribaculaceae bacterium]|nr:TolC family protein [Muribaculaceae bacterium]
MRFFKLILWSGIFLILSATEASASINLEECVAKAEKNYPLIQKYDLLEATKEIDLSEINKSWLPGLNVYAQGTVQNIVPSFPSQLTGIINQMGQSIKGLSKLQYKIGVDLNQTIWDGGSSKARREVTQVNSEVQQAALDVQLYSVRERVENIYFAILLIEAQIERNNETIALINSNIEKLQSMVKNGVALKSDVDMLEAQALTLKQTIKEANAAEKGYREMLSIYIGEEIGNEKLTTPSSKYSIIKSNRPELSLFNKRIQASALMNKLYDTSLMPKIGLFAQAYYGYPGFNYFQSMMNRDLSFNVLAGVKVSWNIGSFYNRKNNQGKSRINALEAENDRDVFLFNSKIQESSELNAIKGIEEVMKDDAKIIELRTTVRKTAESQLKNGVIDATDLLTKITDENIAHLNAKYHEIKLLQNIYKLKYTLNDYE